MSLMCRAQHYHAPRLIAVDPSYCGDVNQWMDKAATALWTGNHMPARKNITMAFSLWLGQNAWGPMLPQRCDDPVMRQAVQEKFWNPIIGAFARREVPPLFKNLAGLYDAQPQGNDLPAFLKAIVGWGLFAVDLQEGRVDTDTLDHMRHIAVPLLIQSTVADFWQKLFRRGTPPSLFGTLQSLLGLNRINRIRWETARDRFGPDSMMTACHRYTQAHSRECLVSCIGHILTEIVLADVWLIRRAAVTAREKDRERFCPDAISDWELAGVYVNHWIRSVECRLITGPMTKTLIPVGLDNYWPHSDLGYLSGPIELLDNEALKIPKILIDSTVLEKKLHEILTAFTNHLGVPAGG